MAHRTDLKSRGDNKTSCWSGIIRLDALSRSV